MHPSVSPGFPLKTSSRVSGKHSPHGTHVVGSDGWQEQLLRRKPQRWMSKLGHGAEVHPDLIYLVKLATDLRADKKPLEGNGEV